MSLISKIRKLLAFTCRCNNYRINLKTVFIDPHENNYVYDETLESCDTAYYTQDIIETQTSQKRQLITRLAAIISEGRNIQLLQRAVSFQNKILKYLN